MYSPPTMTAREKIEKEESVEALRVRKNLERVTRLYWSTCLDNSTMRIENERLKVRSDSSYNR